MRAGVAGDQRAVQLSLTESGAGLLELAQASMAQVLDDLASRTNKRDEVIDALVALGGAIDQAAAERRK